MEWNPVPIRKGVERRLSVGVLNQHLICPLCSGYLVDATGLTKCLHRFCRSCIVAHLKQNRFCPVCETLIPDGQLLECLRPDEVYQNLVYKLIPGLYKREMVVRRRFYADGNLEPPEGEAGGENAFRFYSQEDGISVSLNYYNGNDDASNESPKLYLKCPAAVSVRHLKKFLRIKFELSVEKLIDVIYEDECLKDSFSLMDIAYTFGWNRSEPLKLSFRFYIKPLTKIQPQMNVTSVKTTSTVDPRHQQKQNEYLGHFNLNPRGGQLNKNGSNDTKADESDNSTNSELLIASDKESDDEYHPKGLKKRKRHENKTYSLKRRKSESFTDAIVNKDKSVKNRRKSLYDVVLDRETTKKNEKNEALKKVFSQGTVEPIVKKKKRKKSKHHEPEMKKRKPALVATPSILSVDKDALKLKVKLTPLKLTKEPAKPATNNDDANKIDKERLLHLRSVRHKTINNNNNKEIISSSPSLTISKVDYNEQPNKTILVESKPSLEIMLVKKKTDEVKPEGALDLSEKAQILDLSDKSLRPKEVDKGSAKSTQQSILQMAETLVNRQLAPKMDKPEQSVAVVAMRDLKTLSDAAVNILMAAKTDKPKPENTELKIPVYPRERSIMPVPNLHEIYPKRRLSMIQNQTVRQIPDPSSVILNRNNNYVQQNRPDSSTSPGKLIPPLLKAKLPILTNPKPVVTSTSMKMQSPMVGIRRLDMAKNIESVAAGLTARANALIDAK